MEGGKDMQTVLFDLLSSQPIGSSKFHGGGEYIKTIYKYFVENYSEKCKVIAFYDKSRFIDDYILELNSKYHVQTLDIKQLKQLENVINSSNCDCDIIFMGLPYAYTKIQLPNSIYKISVIHGLRYAEMPIDRFSHLYGNMREKIKSKIKQIKPEYFKYRAINVYSKVYENSDYVIVDSKHTFYSLKTWLGKQDTTKAHIFFPPLKENEGKAFTDNNVHGKYIFMISANRWEKNSYRAIQAMENLFNNGYLSDYKMVICGKLPRRVQVKNKNNYIFKEYVSAKELNTLYSNCDVFFYPTLNEGFGYPPIEAMKYGKTCVVSAVCSLPEICGNAVYYVNPFDIKEMENRLLWASEEKIDETTVKKQFKNINNRQTSDLHKICEVISGGYNNDRY